MKLEHLIEALEEEYQPLTKEFSCPTVFSPNSSTPEDVVNDVRVLWADSELGNDHVYVWFILDGNDYEDNLESYPALTKHLSSFGIQECLIHWTW